MLEIPEMRPQGENLEPHLHPHVPELPEDELALHLRHLLQLQLPLREEGHAQGEVGHPQHTIELFFLPAKMKENKRYKQAGKKGVILN